MQSRDKWTLIILSACVLFLAVLATPTLTHAQANDGMDVCRREADPDRVINFCSRAIQTGQLSTSDLTSALSKRATANYMKHNYDQALKDYDKAIQLNPKDGEQFLNRGIVYEEKRDYDRAIQDFDQAIRLNPKSDRFFSFRGNAYLLKRNYEHALQDFDVSVRLNRKCVQF
jgi:tetratricopeptide (TPR) repeat protein